MFKKKNYYQTLVLKDIYSNKNNRIFFKLNNIFFNAY